jgi:hypothetical protein
MRNFNIIFASTLLSIFALMVGCNKDEQILSNKSPSANSKLETRGSGRNTDNLTETATVIGRKRNNPYTVSNMTSAYNALYKTSISALPVTHQYVKFSPATAEHVRLMQEWELNQKIGVFDFPLDYEVTVGDYYYDPAAPDSLLTFRYASVPIGMTLPSVPSTVIENLVIPPYNSFLTEMAFYQVNEQWEGNNSPHPVVPGTDGNGNPTGPGTGGPGTGGPNPGTNDSCTPACSNYPCCNVGWNDCDEYPCNTTLTPNCQPGSPDWPLCLEINPPGGGSGSNSPTGGGDPITCTCTQYYNGVASSTWTVQVPMGEDCSFFETQWGVGTYVECTQNTPPPPPATNECGCPIPSNIRFPAGCIRVDRDAVPVAVQNVMVKVKDNWFTSDITFTSNQGCWKVEKAYSGTMWMFVQFENPNCEVRAVRKWFYHKALVVADDYVDAFDGPTFNNISLLYSSGAGDAESLARMYWACAHMVNSDNLYRSLVTGDGVPLPRTGINYLLKSATFIAGAPMLQTNQFGSAGNLLVAIDVPNVLSFMAEISGGTPLSPDIVRGYDTESADVFRRINMHELGHASHHAVVGEPYWFAYRTHIVQNSLAGNGVYGSFGDFAPFSDPDRVALGESLGNYMENIYGRPTPTDGLEWEDNFIPTGLMYDLQDDTPTDIVTDPNTGILGIPLISGPDNIRSFTPAMIYGALTPNVNSIRQFRDRLRTNSLAATPNGATAFNNFVDIYDVFN